jgi:hypothetical protein
VIANALVNQAVVRIAYNLVDELCQPKAAVLLETRLAVVVKALKRARVV